MNEQTPVFGAMGRRSGPLRGFRKTRWAVFLLAMQSFHAYPISDLVHRPYPTATMGLVLACEAVFAVLWARTMWLSLATTAPFRRIRWWLAGTVGIGVVLALVLGGNYKGLMIYASIACAVALPLRWTLPAVFGCTLVELTAEFRNMEYLAVPRSDRPNDIATGLALTFFLGLMMWFYRRVMMLVIELREARADLARLAVTEERLRFARDLHDLLGHSLTAIALKSQVARRLAEPHSPVAKEVGDIESVAQQALTEVREAVTGYRARSLADELDTARTTLTDAGIRVEISLDGTPLPAQLDTVLGWVVREGATNVLRHSHAASCQFRLRRDDTNVSLVVRDDGIGVPNDENELEHNSFAPHDTTGSNTPVTRGNGLAGLAERVAGAGGELDSGPAPERGFRLAARLPLKGRT